MLPEHEKQVEDPSLAANFDICHHDAFEQEEGPMRTRFNRTIIVAAFAIALLASSVPGFSQESNEEHADYVRSHYSKQEVMIPVRDGVKLFASVYTPNDHSRTYPILMVRTPYSSGPYGADQYKEILGPSRLYDKEGFIFVFQDVRGRYLSEGTYVNMRPHVAKKTSKTDIDESTDTYDTIEWLLENLDNHNGKVGQWGISYPGFYTSAGAIDSHPALKAVSPQAPIADWFWDDMHRNGAFNLPLAFNFFSSFGQPRPEPTTERADRFEHTTPDGYQFFLDLGPLENVNEQHFKGEVAFWNEITQHPNYDEFWQSRSLIPHLKNVKAAVLTVGGWYDTEDLYGPLKTYRSIEEKNPKASNRIVMGPWIHGGWRRTDGDSLGQVSFGFKTSNTYRVDVEFPFFMHYLKDGAVPALPEALMFETGANRWRRFDAWPPKATKEQSLYLHENGQASFTAPSSAQDTSSEGGESEAHDAFISDPAKPVPYTAQILSRWSKEFMTEDQRFAATRPDVLVYKTEELEEDLTLAGPILADLFVSTTGSSADWIVKVIDVFPGELPGYDEDSGEPNLGGMQRLVRAEVLRGRFRDGFEAPKPFTPNEVTPVSFELLDVLHTFQKGHRIMIHIQSTWFPWVDRNPQSYVPNIFEAEEKDFIKATHRIYRSEQHPSRVRVGVLE